MTVHRETLADALRERIIAGGFAPGERLSESALAEQLDVSRNTLREAFRVLAEQRLVEHVPHRGVSVASPTIADVVDIYRVRRTVETSVVAEASPRHPAVERMRAAIERAEAGFAAEDWGAVGTANMEFHDALVSLGDSPRLERAYRNVAAELRLAFLEIDDLEGLHVPFVSRNREVLEALVGDGPAAAAALLDRYLTTSERQVLGALSRSGRS